MKWGGSSFIWTWRHSASSLSDKNFQSNETNANTAKYSPCIIRIRSDMSYKKMLNKVWSTTTVKMLTLILFTSWDLNWKIKKDQIEHRSLWYTIIKDNTGLGLQCVMEGLEGWNLLILEWRNELPLSEWVLFLNLVIYYSCCQFTDHCPVTQTKKSRAL